MKLLVVSHSCATPLNQQLYAAVERLTGWDVTLVIPSNWVNEYGRAASAERCPELAGRVIGVPVWKPGHIVLHAYRDRLKRLIRDANPDLIYVNHEPYAVATWQFYRANATTLNRPIGFHTCQNLIKRYPVPFRWSEAYVYRESSFAFPVSRDALAMIRSKGYSGPARLLPFWVDPSTYYPRAGEDLRRSLQRSPDDVVIGYVGRITAEKGLRTLVAALEVIRRLPWRLVMVGAGPYEQEFDALLARAGLVDRVIRKGFVPHAQTPEFLSAFDALVIPSETTPRWKEQFGRVIIEAMACGTPVVGSDSGEIPYLIRETGGGLVFPEGNPVALAARLAELIESAKLRRDLAEAGRTSVLTSFSAQAVATTLAGVIAAAAGRLSATNVPFAADETSLAKARPG